MLRLFGMHHDAEQALSRLTKHQRALLISAMNWHSLLEPGKTLRYQVYISRQWPYPQLTGCSTYNDSLVRKHELSPCIAVTASSHVVGRHLTSRERDNSRYIVVPSDNIGGDAVQWPPSADRWTVREYKKLEQHGPIAFDVVRELLRRTAERRNNRFIPRLDEPRSGQEMAVDVETDRTDIQQEESLRRPRAVIIGMYWLQPGGAERWGMETIRLAKQSGLLPIVITDRESQHPWITDPICEGALMLTLTSPLPTEREDVQLLNTLFQRYDIRGICIHHCQWMYDQLWWVKRHHPETRVVDSLHILEYVMRGGYPRQAVLHDRWIDLHHVISPQLEEWMVKKQSIDPAKVTVAPLVGLTSDMKDIQYRSKHGEGQMKVAFVGRMTRQKRPEVFVFLARRLDHMAPGKFRFIMHGNGDMDDFVNNLIARNHMEGIIERRSDDVPVHSTYADADVLVVSSLNEGITLTTIEAICSGVPVISTDVGSQRTLVPEQGLLPRLSVAALRRGCRMLMKLYSHENEREQLWQEELRRLRNFSERQSAEQLFSHLFAEWSK